MSNEISRRRLANQRLIGPALKTPAAVVAWMGAVQAQDFAGAKWGVGQRTRGATDGSVEKAFDDGSILRTHILRPTWHFVSPADIRWMLALSAPRVHVANGHPYRKLELDGRVLARSRAAIERALRGGKHLTRSELAAALGRSGIDARGQRLAYLVMHAELDAVICSGPRRGRQFTYALLDERVPPAKTLPRDEAIAALTRRYLASHGPATVRDYVWWSGLMVRDARAGLDMIGSALEKQIVNGLTYWSLGGQLKASKDSASVFLLPNYDESLIAYRDRGVPVKTPTGEGSVTRAPDPFAHHLLVDGRVSGSWRRTMNRGETLVEVAPYGNLPRATVKAIEHAAACYGLFLQSAVTISFGRPRYH